MNVGAFLLALMAIFISAKLFGALAERIGQPAVLGELIGGIAVGVSGLHLVNPQESTIHLLSQLGVIILLFLIGLQTDLNRLLSVGRSATLVAVVGVALPFVAGAAAGVLLGYKTMIAIFLGASLTATSVGITARVLSDLGHLQDDESQIILGAAVVDDIIGLVILALVSGVAQSAGSAMIIGSFFAGLLLARTKKAKQIERVTHIAGLFLIPIFFVTVGAAIDLPSLSREDLLLGLILTVVGVLGKIASGFTVFRPGIRRTVIGVGMIPRGEVGLIFAQIGLTAGLLNSGLYSAVALMVMLTTLMTPPLLRALLGARVAGESPGNPDRQQSPTSDPSD